MGRLYLFLCFLFTGFFVAAFPQSFFHQRMDMYSVLRYFQFFCIASQPDRIAGIDLHHISGKMKGPFSSFSFIVEDLFIQHLLRKEIRKHSIGFCPQSGILLDLTDRPLREGCQMFCNFLPCFPFVRI